MPLNPVQTRQKMADVSPEGVGLVNQLLEITIIKQLFMTN